MPGSQVCYSGYPGKDRARRIHEQQPAGRTGGRGDGRRAGARARLRAAPGRRRRRRSRWPTSTPTAHDERRPPRSRPSGGRALARALRRDRSSRARGRSRARWSIALRTPRRADQQRRDLGRPGARRRARGRPRPLGPGDGRERQGLLAVHPRRHPPRCARRAAGAIINISSIGSRMASGVYGVSKLALNQLTFTTRGGAGRPRDHRQRGGPGADLQRGHAAPGVAGALRRADRAD